MVGLPSIPRLLEADNPLLEGVVRSGVVELAPAFVVECGRTFAYWYQGKERELVRIIGAGPAGALPARCVVLIGGEHEVVAFLPELELWTPPKRLRDPRIDRRDYGRHRRIW